MQPLSLYKHTPASTLLSKLEPYRKPVVFLFFFSVLLLGIFIHRDYGVSADERISRVNAAVTAKYLLTRFAPAKAAADTSLKYIPELHTWKDRDYGIAFEIPVFLLEKVLRLKDLRDIHFLHHLCIFLMFWVSLLFFYLLVKERYQSWPFALLATVFLLLSPRIFADAFYNSKDLVFMSFFIIGLYTMIKFLKEPDWRWALFHALACAVLINVRIMGVVVPLATVAVFAFDWLKNHRKQPLKKAGLVLGLYVVLLFAFIVLLWPFLWEAPLTNFVFAFKNMSKFRWDGVVLFAGRLVKAPALPWYYGPFYIAITTPLTYTVFFLLGLFFTIRTVIHCRFNLYNNEAEKQDLLFLAFFLLPLGAIIVLKSVLYDGWRHLYFVYPAFLLVALRGLAGVYERTKQLGSQLVVYALAAVVGISLISTAVFMVNAHPYQHVYFSLLPAKTVEKNFERDYWGLSFKEMIDYVLKHDTGSKVYLHIENPWSEQNGEVFRKEDRDRIQWIYGDDPAGVQAAPGPVYFLTSYRAHPQPYLHTQEIYSRRVSGVKVFSVFRER